MKFLALVIAGLIIANSAMADTSDDKLAGAVWTEWLVANCPDGQIPAMTVIVANMVINGSEPDKVTALREFIRSEWHKHYSSPSEACEEAFGTAEIGQD